MDVDGRIAPGGGPLQAGHQLQPLQLAGERDDDRSRLQLGAKGLNFNHDISSVAGAADKNDGAIAPVNLSVGGVTFLKSAFIKSIGGI